MTTRTRTFVACIDVYARGPGPLKLELVHAQDLDDCIRKLEPGLAPSPENAELWEGPAPTPTEWLKEANGDGMNAYIIKELVAGRLVPTGIDFDE
jgi:hypothetical protein